MKIKYTFFGAALVFLLNGCGGNKSAEEAFEETETS